MSVQPPADISDWEILPTAGKKLMCAISEEDKHDEEGSICLVYEDIQSMPNEESTTRSISQDQKVDLPICSIVVQNSSNNIKNEALLSDENQAPNHKSCKASLSPAERSSLGLALLCAIKDGNEMHAIDMLERGADPNVRDDYGFALTQAIRGGHWNLVRKMLEKKANLDVRDNYGYALTQLIRKGHETLGIDMVERGANPNVEDNYGCALTQAIRGGYLNLVRKMLEKNPNLDVKDNYGYALTQLIRKGHETLAIDMVERGANPNLKDTYGTVILQAKSRGLTRLEELLLERGVEAPSIEHNSSGLSQITINQDTPNHVKIDGVLPHGTNLQLSSANGTTHYIISSNGGIIFHSVSAGARSKQILGNLPEWLQRS